MQLDRREILAGFGAVGAVPLDVNAAGLDVAACPGFKWLIADFGLGFLYAREDLLDRVMQRTQVGVASTPTR